MPVFIGGLLLGCRAVEQGEPMEVGYIFAGFKDKLGQLALVGVLYMVGVMVIGIGVAVVGAWACLARSPVA